MTLWRQLQTSYRNWGERRGKEKLTSVNFRWDTLYHCLDCRIVSSDLFQCDFLAQRMGNCTLRPMVFLSSGNLYSCRIPNFNLKLSRLYRLSHCRSSLTVPLKSSNPLQESLRRADERIEEKDQSNENLRNNCDELQEKAQQLSLLIKEVGSSSSFI
jgi:hypothetical protein